MTKNLDDYVEFKVKYFKKYDIKILCITYLKEILVIEDDIFYKFLDKYKNSMIENKKCFLFVESRNIKSINFSDIISKANDIALLDPVARETLHGVVYFINNPFFKSMGNNIMKLYKPAVDTKICNDNEEAMEFCKNILNKKK